jgi:toxin ParE1/3/4
MSAKEWVKLLPENESGLYHAGGGSRSGGDALYTTTTQNNLDAARAFVWMLKEKLMLLADNPDLGRVREEITGAGTASLHPLRSFLVNKYVVFYEPMEDGVRILRVLHASRDITDIF